MTLYLFKQSKTGVPPATPDSVDSDQTSTDTITDSNKDSDIARKAKEEALGYVEVNFEGVKNPRQEVERGFRFWDAVCFSSSSSFLLFSVYLSLLS
jgi:hypothetical protein